MLHTYVYHKVNKSSTNVRFTMPRVLLNIDFLWLNAYTSCHHRSPTHLCTKDLAHLHLKKIRRGKKLILIVKFLQRKRWKHFAFIIITLKFLCTVKLKFYTKRPIPFFAKHFSSVCAARRHQLPSLIDHKCNPWNASSTHLERFNLHQRGMQSSRSKKKSFCIFVLNFLFSIFRSGTTYLTQIFLAG